VDTTDPKPMFTHTNHPVIHFDGPSETPSDLRHRAAGELHEDPLVSFCRTPCVAVHPRVAISHSGRNCQQFSAEHGRAFLKLGASIAIQLRLAPMQLAGKVHVCEHARTIENALLRWSIESFYQPRLGTSSVFMPTPHSAALLKQKLTMPVPGRTGF